MKWKFNGKYIFFNSLTTTDSIALPDKSWFYCEIRFFLIYAFFGLNFILQKFCPCKRNDKYQVCSRSVFNCKNHLVINDLTLLLILGQFRNLLVSWTIFTIILFALKWLLSHSPSGLRLENVHFFTLHPYNPPFLGSDGSDPMGS